MIEFSLISQFLESIRLPMLLFIALVYAGFDLFNKRDIPDSIAYISLGIGIIFTLSLPFNEIVYSALVALVVGGISYFLYRAGQLGLGDGFEFVALSLIMPLAPQPLLAMTFQLGLPLILSIFVATGICAIILVPIYYLFIAKKNKLKEPKVVEGNKTLKAGTMLLAYACLFLFMTYYFGFSFVSLAIVALVAIPSVLMIIYERKIMLQMIAIVPATELENGDIVAVDFMSKKDFAFFRSKYSGFGRLVDLAALKKLSGVKKSLPVYKNAIPLAFPTLLGVVIALLFGNLLLLLI